MATQNSERRKKLPFTANMIIVMVCTVLLVLAFKVLISDVNSKIVNSNIETVKELVLHDKNNIRNSIELRWDTMEGAERRMSVRRWASMEELMDAEHLLLNNIPDVDRMGLLDSDGTLYMSTGLVQRNSYYQKICEGRTERFVIRLNTESQMTEAEKEALIEAIPVSYTVCGKEMKWMICQFPVSDLESELKIGSYDDNGFSSVIDSEGNYILNISKTHSFGEFDNLFDGLKGAAFEGYKSIDEVRAAAAGAASVVFSLNGRKYLMVISSFDFADWYIVSVVPMSVFSAQSNAIIFRFIILLGIITVILAAVLYLMFRQRREREMAEQERINRESEERGKLIDGITASYNVAYVVNMTDDTFEQLRMDETIIGYGRRFETFTQAKEFFIGLLNPTDRERMRELLDYDSIRQKLKDNKSFNSEYRLPINGAMIWHRMNVSAIDKNTVTIGFAVDDLGITKKHLEDKRFSEYFALYEIDLDSETAKIVIDSPYYPVDRSGTAVPYKAAMTAFSESLSGEAREFFRRMSDTDTVRKAFADEDKYSYTYRSNNIEEKWVDLTSFVTLRHADGTPAMFTLGFSYIDSFGAQKQELQEQLKLALDAANIESQRIRMINGILDSSDWIYEIDADDHVISAQYGDLIKKKTDAVSIENPMRWIELVHPEDRERVLAKFTAAITDRSGNTAYDEIYRILDRDGSYRWCRSVGEVLRQYDGSGEYIGMAMDMTRQLEEQQKRLLGAMPLSNDVLNKANIGMWAFELDEGQPPRMYDDETMLGLVGLDHQVPPEEAYHAWYDHIDEGSYDLVNDAVAKMMDGEHAEVQYPWHYPDGRTIIVRCGGIRNYGYTKGIRIEGTHQNVTETLHFDEEERRREKQQKEDEIARAKAEAADKAKTEFLFNMSHDIRTPMNAILGYTDIALNHIDEQERVNDSLKKIKTSGGHLLNLINDILEMSRIEAGRMEIVNAPVNIREATEGIVNMSQALAATKDITFNTEIGDLKNPYIYSDELHTNQIIINLISNAIKYTNPGGTVDYRVEQISDPVNGIADYRVTVKDNGIGMSEEFQKHLFESFAREQTATVSKQEGAGLGLAIVKRIVDLCGGTVRAQSKQGKGTTFTVELPLAVMDDAAIEAFEASRHAVTEVSTDISFEGRKVLLVEDNEMNREIATEVLEENGLSVEGAKDGALAVRKVMERGVDYYDFILMDIQMPVMNGYEATAEIRRLPGGDRVPVIALSANAFKEDKDKSFAAGMNDHVAKPINVKELFSALAKFL